MGQAPIAEPWPTCWPRVALLTPPALGGNPELDTLMARCNRTELLSALGRYRQAIAGLERLVELEDWQGLEGVLRECGEVRQGFLG